MLVTELLFVSGLLIELGLLSVLCSSVKSHFAMFLTAIGCKAEGVAVAISFGLHSCSQR